MFNNSEQYRNQMNHLMRYKRREGEAVIILCICKKGIRSKSENYTGEDIPRIISMSDLQFTLLAITKFSTSSDSREFEAGRVVRSPVAYLVLSLLPPNDDLVNKESRAVFQFATAIRDRGPYTRPRLVIGYRAVIELGEETVVSVHNVVRVIFVNQFRLPRGVVSRVIGVMLARWLGWC